MRSFMQRYDDVQFIRRKVIALREHRLDVRKLTDDELSRLGAITRDAFYEIVLIFSKLPYLEVFGRQ